MTQAVRSGGLSLLISHEKGGQNASAEAILFSV